jgi:uncharacterized membrane protein YraQ (UPF0718 family)
MEGKKGKRSDGGWWFLAIVVALYLLLGVSDTALAAEALALFTKVLGQVVPALALVWLLLFLAELLLDKKRVRQHLGKGSGLRGWLGALFAGVFAVGPIYGWYAVLAELRQKGMRDALIATFLYSRALKLPLLPLMVHYFGLAYTVTLSLGILLFALLNGLLLERLLGGSPQEKAERNR